MLPQVRQVLRKTVPGEMEVEVDVEVEADVEVGVDVGLNVEMGLGVDVVVVAGGDDLNFSFLTVQCIYHIYYRFFTLTHPNRGWENGSC
jgi:hypothetical protein